MLTYSEVETIFDRYDRDGNGVLDSTELEQFWADVVRIMKFPSHTSEAIKNEAIAQAVEQSRMEFDDGELSSDGLIQKDEFITHIVELGVAVPKDSSEHKYFRAY